jgi:hypothetical protein
MKEFWQKLDMEETQTGQGRNANTTGGRKAGEISKRALLRDLFETKWEIALKYSVLNSRPSFWSLIFNVWRKPFWTDFIEEGTAKAGRNLLRLRPICRIPITSVPTLVSFYPNTSKHNESG